MEKLSKMKEIRKKIKSCNACELRSVYDSPVPCAGSHSAEVMFIGEAPGAEEVESGKPFVGKSGKMLRSAILDSGLSIDDIFITNVICCRPLNNIFPKDFKIIDICINWLYEQIKFLQILFQESPML
jgi:DNA polymerase